MLNDNLFIATHDEVLIARPLAVLRHAMTHDKRVILLRTQFVATGLISLVAGMLFVATLVGSMLAVPALVALRLAGIITTPGFDLAFLLGAYALGFLGATAMLKGHHPVREYRQRRTLEHTRELVIDFDAQALIASEHFPHRPAQNRIHRVPLREVSLSARFIEIKPDDASDCGASDSYDAHLVLGARAQAPFAWVRDELQRAVASLYAGTAETKRDAEAQLNALNDAFEGRKI